MPKNQTTVKSKIPKDQNLLKKDHENDEVFYDAIPVSVATFKSGTNKPVHQWFRLTPSFGPDLVKIMLKELKHEISEIVLDPYAGASTTLIECKLNGIPSYGFEINPLLYYVGKTSLELDSDSGDLDASLNKVLKLYLQTKNKFSNVEVEKIGLLIPPIHNPHRWWRKDVLKDLLILKHSIKTASILDKHKELLLLTIAGVLVPDLSNVTLGKLQLHFIDRSSDEIDVIKTFTTHAKQIIEDIEKIKDTKFIKTPAKLFHTDALNPILKSTIEKVSSVITSPPYPNRYSYVWNTRPHLFFLDIFSSPKESSALDLKTIGGTWGTATSILAKGIIEPKYEIIRKVVEPAVAKIREQDNLMANYVMKYFNALADQIVAMDPYLAENARVAYVVGCSEIKGVRIETDVWLGNIFKGLGLGYKRTKIHQFRKRNSGKDLFESIVYSWKE